MVAQIITTNRDKLIAEYRQKWCELALSTKPIDRSRATSAINAAYAFAGRCPPEILFCDSPYTALEAIFNRSKLQLGKKQLWSEMDEQISVLCYQFASKDRQLESRVKGLGLALTGQIQEQSWKQGQRKSQEKLKAIFEHCIRPELLACNGAWLDFQISVNDRYCEAWEVFENIVRHCGWIFAFTKTAIVCDRPRILEFDRDNLLHAIGKPAIKFADGVLAYYYHGIELPKKYGKTDPSRWRPQWVIEENNAEIRRVLIQEIGYDRICQELQATEVDEWEEYTLLKIKNFIDNIDWEPIYLLKMTCPSTRFIHALRVPPNMRSAYDAICWVNWGIDPRRFSVQT
ncbi:MAG: hypothetical protein F6J93_29655 [Oscillatoria sp. SIO1A7]|nr:hypothetical protein [Oscillatoria sp. SIO1A7]